MLDWFRQLFKNICDFFTDIFSDIIDWFYDIFQSLIDWFLGLFGSLWDWLKSILSSLFSSIRLDDLLDYTSDFAKQITDSDVISTLSDILHHILPWIPWDFLGWAFSFIILLYIHVMAYKLARKLFFKS